ncbi:MAG: AraC family transcriptional regulator [Rhodocyclales bacterium]|nr:AraC family transcriptional regulator [Rhodocyclales bacterium]
MSHNPAHPVLETADSVSRLLEHIGLRARTFFAGPLCGVHAFGAEEGVGHLHVVRAGTLRAVQPGHRRIEVCQPTLLFYPRPLDHRLDADDRAADVLCASISYGAGMDNAITQSFPPVLEIPFAASPRIEATLALLFDEAAEAQTGRQVLLDRLCDVLLIQIVRHAIASRMVEQGVLAGLAHPRLGRVLVELLDAPRQAWTLDAMASLAHLSRNAFARLFRAVVGKTATEFLTQVRIALAQRLLRQGRAVALAAEEVGYNSQPAFSRAFIRETGCSPSAWQRRHGGRVG